ncbi:hypothetical protein JCM9957A_49780 [Kineosporia succinea]
MRAMGALGTWVDWADIIGGFSTAGALIAASVAAVYAKRAAASSHNLLQVERGRDAANEMQSIREQARLIGAWFEVKPDPDYTPQSMAEMGQPGPSLARLHISNLSNQPVYEVRVRALDGNAEPINFEVLPPQATDIRDVSMSLVKPNDSYSAALILEFRDAAGKEWVRHRGRLAQVLKVGGSIKPGDQD